MAIATAGGVYPSFSGFRQSQYESVLSLGHDTFSIRNGQIPGALPVDMRAIYECMRLGDDKLCNATRCKNST